MLYRVFGPNGSGKSEYLLQKLKEAVQNGKECFWIAPEQQSLSAERRICEALGKRGTLNCEVLNFERLPNRVARSEGNLTVASTDAGARNLLMSMALNDIKHTLIHYGGSCNDISFVKNCVAQIGRFKAEGIDREKLMDASESASLDDPVLKEKLHDLSLILEKYDSMFNSELCDPYDSLSLLAETLKTSDFFKGSVVFVDGYYTFTYQEYEVLKHIIASCDDCYITFVADGRREMFADNRAAADKIKASAYKCHDDSKSSFTFGTTDALRHIEAHLWDDKVTEESCDGSVKLITAHNMFDECEAIASHILTLVRGGMRYRDICVLTPDASAYGDILESTLSANGIPCFASRKENVLSKPLFAFILSCLEVAYGNFSVPSVRRYIKSGYSGLGVEESDFLLRYIEMWGLNGQKYYDGEEWKMNPDGYDAMSESSGRILNAVNRAREKLSRELSPLRETLISENITVAEVAKALYTHLVDLNVPDRLAETAQRMADRGDSDGALREKQLMDVAVSIFDRLYTLSGDRHIPLKRLSDIIECMASEYSVGSIPSSLDAVATGDPRLFRGDGYKAVFICGLNDGVFPSYGKGNAFFDDNDLVRLEGEGINITASGDAYIRRERFLFYMACTSASHKLILSYPSGSISGQKLRPSHGYLRIKKLFKNIEEKVFGGNESDLIYSCFTALSRYPMLRDPALKKAVGQALEKKRYLIDGDRKSIFAPEASVDFPHYNEFGISPSAFERYVYCPFSYYASRLMHLKKLERIEFSNAQSGTFIHKALEEYMRHCTKGGVFLGMDEKQMDAECERVIANYFPDVDPMRFQRTKRGFKRTLKALYKNLNSEFGVCSFMPIGFEVKVGMGPESKRPYKVNVDGTDVYVRGIVDRVDQVEIDGQKYIRITDYKSGGKTFSLDLIDKGLDMQMPMYLFSLCDSEGAKPAGCLYYTAKLTYVERNLGETDEELEKRIQKGISRSGIFSNNTEVIMAADSSEEGLFRPVRITASGEIDKRYVKKALSEEQFGELKGKLTDKMHEVASGMLGGNMNIKPMHIDQYHDACKYCDYKLACRYDGRE